MSLCSPLILQLTDFHLSRRPKPFSQWEGWQALHSKKFGIHPRVCDSITCPKLFKAGRHISSTVLYGVHTILLVWSFREADLAIDLSYFPYPIRFILRSSPTVVAPYRTILLLRYHCEYALRRPLHSIFVLIVSFQLGFDPNYCETRFPRCRWLPFTRIVVSFMENTGLVQGDG